MFLTCEIFSHQTPIDSYVKEARGPIDKLKALKFYIVNHGNVIHSYVRTLVRENYPSLSNMSKNKNA